MLLSELLTPDRVRVPLQGASKEALLEELVGVLRDSGALADADAVLGAVRERERVLSTGVGSGVAIPHGKSESAPELAMAAGVTGAGSARSPKRGSVDGSVAGAVAVAGGPLLFVLTALVTGPLSEEFGWRGYAQPRLRRRFSPLVTSLVLGVCGSTEPCWATHSSLAVASEPCTSTTRSPRPIVVACTSSGGGRAGGGGGRVT